MTTPATVGWKVYVYGHRIRGIIVAPHPNTGRPWAYWHGKPFGYVHEAVDAATDLYEQGSYGYGLG